MDRDALFAAMLEAIENAAKARQEKQEEKNNRKAAAEMGKELHEIYLGFVDAGFNEQQAFQLMLTTFDKVGGAF